MASLLTFVASTGNQSTAAGPSVHSQPNVGGSRPASLTPLAVDELDLPAAWIDGTSLGSPDAPIVVQVWHDYFCPSCAQWAANVEPDIVNTYVRNGQVRLEFHHFPLGQHEPGGSRTALAALCAADQGLFYRFQHRLFKLSAELGQADLTTAALVGAAGELGMDPAAFASVWTMPHIGQPCRIQSPKPTNWSYPTCPRCWSMISCSTTPWTW